jgi:hypothetical protein
MRVVVAGHLQIEAGAIGVHAGLFRPKHLECGEPTHKSISAPPTTPAAVRHVRPTRFTHMPTHANPQLRATADGPNEQIISENRPFFNMFAGGCEQPRTLGWRREWDSNPRYGCPYTRFPSVRLRPLGHPSVPGNSPPRRQGAERNEGLGAVQRDGRA